MIFSNLVISLQAYSPKISKVALLLAKLNIIKLLILLGGYDIYKGQLTHQECDTNEFICKVLQRKASSLSLTKKNSDLDIKCLSIKKTQAGTLSKDDVSEPYLG